MVIVLPAAAEARQLGALVSPGPLSRFHADQEGIRKCQNCHQPGKGVTAARCLSCHEPVARRIAARRGVHRNVTTDCVACHVEHMGREAELRPFDIRGFNHLRETGYPLDGRHARLAADCAACHTTRSFLAASTACVSCHADPHKGSLGSGCQRCHSTAAAFTSASRSFDHSATAFPLAGAHTELSCASCHRGNDYTRLKAATCASCHADPHGRRFGARCEACHVTATWRTTRVDHARTAYPLLGRHATVPCANCHTRPALEIKPASDRCSACHADPHAGAFKQDCRACHSETGFANAPFDHSATGFLLTGAHGRVRCADCHTGTRAADRGVGTAVVDFRGLTTACTSCHTDVHERELGTSCESCHSTASFALLAYEHRRTGEFFAGQHATVACSRCHVPTVPRGPLRSGTPLPVRYTETKRACSSCHADAHLGQVSGSCESCHTTLEPRFAVRGFAHERTRFPLTGKHAAIGCRECHRVETGRFPSGEGTALRLTGLKAECIACHTDVHDGQLAASCTSCHSTDTFRITDYKHLDASMHRFLVGAHAAARCDQCHRPGPTRSRTPHASVVQYRIEMRCATCHTDVHRGQLGERCEDCHRVGVKR